MQAEMAASVSSSAASVETLKHEVRLAKFLAAQVLV
jgi:hypothetical protein